MSDSFTKIPYRVRVRYAECDAWGELHAMYLVPYFDGAVAEAFKQRGIDWRQATKPDGPYHLAGLQIEVNQSPGYDSDLEIRVLQISSNELKLEVRVAAFKLGGTAEIAQGTIAYGRRIDSKGQQVAIDPAIERAIMDLGTLAATP